MSWKKNKFATFLMIICLLTSLGVGCGANHNKGTLYRVETWEVAPNKYGYKILRDERIMIAQPFVPGLSGQHGFTTPADALRVGELVRERLMKGEDFTVTQEDLQRLKII